MEAWRKRLALVVVSAGTLGSFAVPPTAGQWIPTWGEIDEAADAVYALENSPSGSCEAPTFATPGRDECGGVDLPEDPPCCEGSSPLPRSDAKNKPVLFIHGISRVDFDDWNRGGDDCVDLDKFDAIQTMLTNNGYTGTSYDVAWYGGETASGSALYPQHHPDGATDDHDRWHGGATEHDGNDGCGGGSQPHDRNTDLRHVAWHIAWTIHDHFSKNNQAVDVVAHSAGGLLIRYAIARTNSADSEWPPFLYVEDVITYGSPHGSHNFDAPGTCLLPSVRDDVRQMCSRDGFMKWLKKNAKNPTSDWQTDWTVVGSECDARVDEPKAVAMSAPQRVKYRSGSGWPCPSHGQYMSSFHSSTTLDGRVYAWDGSQWVTRSSFPRSGFLAVNALLSANCLTC